MKVALCLDDFGNVRANSEMFLERMKKHFNYVGQSFEHVQVWRASDIVNDERLATTWSILSTWLTRGDERLDAVLAVCKLLLPEQTSHIEEIQRSLTRKPRKLMTPAVVWSCFTTLMESGFADGGALATLGGFDERPLWKTWRDIFGQAASRRVCHLYNPELRLPLGAPNSPPLTMAEQPEEFYWSSREDIRRALSADTADPSNAHGLLGWLIRQCIILPSWLNGNAITLQNRAITSPDELTLLGSNRTALIDEVSRHAERILLQ